MRYDVVYGEGGRGLAASASLSDENAVPASTLLADAAAAFEEILYWIYVSRDDFDLPKFRAALPPRVREADDAGVSVAPRDEKRGEYHVIMTWRVTADEVTFLLEYHKGPLEHAPDEHEPYAEDLMQWLGSFFVADHAKGYVHARMKYSTATRRTTFALALQDSLPHSAELYGIALRLKDKPSGASSVRLTRGKSDWYAEVVGERSIIFQHFSPFADVALLESVLNAFLAEGEL